MSTTYSILNKKSLHKLYDSVVIGLGGAGSSSLYYLSQTGRKVLGIEQFNLLHNQGSSHGDSRIIRQAYFEGQYYVPFVKEAYILWDQIEKQSGKKIFLKTKSINIGDDTSKFVQKCKTVCDLHDLKYKILDSNEINTNYPFFNIPHTYKGLLEDKGGILFPEKCIEAYIEEAVKNKADVLTDSKVEKITYDNNDDVYNIFITRYNRDNASENITYIIRSKSLILSCGSWINKMITDNFKLSLNFTVDLNYVYYFKLKNGKKYSDFPLYLISNNDCEFYGFPDIGNGNGYKMSIYHQNMSYTDQSLVRREFSKEKFEYLMGIARKFLRDVQEDNIELIKHLTCVYTSTPDKDFLIDYLPGTKENVVIVSACSGHGFKFMSRVGDHAAKLLDKKEKIIEQFRIDRLLDKL